MKLFTQINRLAGEINDTPSIPLAGRRVWGRANGQGAGNIPGGYHVEILSTDERINSLAFKALAQDWQRLSAKRREALRLAACALAREENHRAVENGRLELWVTACGAKTEAMEQRLRRATAVNGATLIGGCAA